MPGETEQEEALGTWGGRPRSSFLTGFASEKSFPHSPSV